MLQRAVVELSEVLGCETADPLAPVVPDRTTSAIRKNSTLHQLEELLTVIGNEAEPIDGLSATLADIRRMIDKAFAARSAFHSQLEGIPPASESSNTEPTEVPIPPIKDYPRARTERVGNVFPQFWLIMDSVNFLDNLSNFPLTLCSPLGAFNRNSGSQSPR